MREAHASMLGCCLAVFALGALAVGCEGAGGTPDDGMTAAQDASTDFDASIANPFAGSGGSAAAGGSNVPFGEPDVYLECNSDADCVTLADQNEGFANRHCWTPSHRCVECVDDGHCEAVTGTPDSECRMLQCRTFIRCDENVDCEGMPSTLAVCVRGRCGRCQYDEDCGPGARCFWSVCYPESRVDPECLAHTCTADGYACHADAVNNRILCANFDLGEDAGSDG